MPHFPIGSGHDMDMVEDVQEDSERKSTQPSAETRVKNRRKRYLDLQPEYFSADLELAGRLALSFPIMIPAEQLVIRVDPFARD